MTRPALSASRSIDVIEFLATFPERAFTLSEISRATNINIASCHAVLTALADRGYLSRSANQKTYELGLSLIAVGQAALNSQPIVARVKQAAEQLLAEFGVPVLVSTPINDEVLAVISLEDAEGRDAGMRVGERLPFVAPIGAPFLAWGSKEDVDAWIARRTSPLDPSVADELFQDLEQTRQRGFQIQFRAPSGPSIASLLAEMASSSSRTADYKDEMSRLINSIDPHSRQPEKIVDDEFYDVMLLSAPIFDRSGKAVYNLSLGGFPQHITGAMLNKYADRLMRYCLEIMRADRSQAWRNDRPFAPQLAGT